MHRGAPLMDTTMCSDIAGDPVGSVDLGYLTYCSSLSSINHKRSLTSSKV